MLNDAANALVACSKRSLPSRIAHGHPLTAHVLEAARPRVGMIEVGDQLAENPRLIRGQICPGNGAPSTAVVMIRRQERWRA